MFKLAVVGLDTSHAVKFTELIQGKDKMIDGVKVVSCMRIPSAFHSEPDQDIRQKDMEGMGVKVTRVLEEALEGVDGILLELNDPGLHLEHFRNVAEFKLPVFIDKPMADTLENALKMCDIIRERKLRAWTSSSLRFSPELKKCAEELKAPTVANIYGPLGKAPRGSSLVWYGIHTFEMLMAIMGRGMESVFAVEDKAGVVSIVNYKDGRRAVVECTNGIFIYGGRSLSNDKMSAFRVNFADASVLYGNLISVIRDFFLDGVIPVSLEESLEIQSIMDSAERSLASGKRENVRQL